MPPTVYAVAAGAGRARGRGRRLAVGFRHVLGYYTGWRDSFAQQRARPDFVTETESGDDYGAATTTTTTTKCNRCGSSHTHTQAHKHALHAPVPVGDRHTTGARGHSKRGGGDDDGRRPNTHELKLIINAYYIMDSIKKKKKSSDSYLQTK